MNFTPKIFWVMFMTQLWAVQSYPVEKEVLWVTLDTSEDVLYPRKKWSDCHKTKKQIHLLDARPQIWPSVMSLIMTLLTLNFQGQILNLLYISEKWANCHETKNKLIKGMLGLKCDRSFWPRPWPWPWILNVKYLICKMSRKYGPIATRRKTYTSIES